MTTKPAEFDRIRGLLVKYAARLQDVNDEPPGQFLLAHSFLQAVEMLDLLLMRAKAAEVSPAGWKLVPPHPPEFWINEWVHPHDAEASYHRLLAAAEKQLLALAAGKQE